MKGRVSEHFLKDVPPSARPDSPSRRNSGRGGADAPVAQPAQSMKIDLKDLANNPQLQQQLSMMLKGTMNGGFGLTFFLCCFILLFPIEIAAAW
jgi:hypothetical protein